MYFSVHSNIIRERTFAWCGLGGGAGGGGKGGTLPGIQLKHVVTPGFHIEYHDYKQN